MSHTTGRMPIAGVAGILFLLAAAGCTDGSVGDSAPAAQSSAAVSSPTETPSPAATPAATEASASPTATAAPTVIAAPTAAVAPTCAVSDQNSYIYNPDRLSVRAACVRVTGVVLAIRTEADGDLHVRVQLDPPFAGMLTPGNQQQCGQGVCGLLVVEPICVHSVTQTDAIAVCAADPDPLRSLPSVGSHIWLEGRSVLDRDHYDWAELHPLYRWGPD